MTDTKLEEWISITEAARRLSASGDRVDRSALSRYIGQHDLELRPDGRQNLVEFVGLSAHRGENIRLRPSAATPWPATESRRVRGSQSDGMARKANADADLREMELARRRGQLTPVSEVSQAGADAIALMQSAFDQAIEPAASAMAVKHGWDERKARIELKQFARSGLEAFNRALREALDQQNRERFTGDQDDAGGVATLALQ